MPQIQTERLRRQLFLAETWYPVNSHFNASIVQRELLGGVPGDLQHDWLEIEIELGREFMSTATECEYTWDCQCGPCLRLDLD